MKSSLRRLSVGHWARGMTFSKGLGVWSPSLSWRNGMRQHADFMAESCFKKRSDPSPARRGVSLIEMVVVISMLTVMISLAGMTFHLLLQSEKQVTQSFVTERVVSQLAVQFRDDAHQSTSAAVTTDPDSATSKMEFGRSSGTWCRYLSTAEGVTRLLLKDESVVSREDYRLPDCLISFAAGEGTGTSIRTLLIDRPGIRLVKKERMPSPRRLLRIDAHLGLQLETAEASIPSTQDAAPAIPDAAPGKSDAAPVIDADASSPSNEKEEHQ
jgi:prepilin-type N-terminal cleavage/methylation domain-containing protein